MSYNEFVTETKKAFTKMGYTDAETDKYFKAKESILRRNYEGFNERKVAGYSPSATASCLDMMY